MFTRLRMKTAELSCRKPRAYRRCHRLPFARIDDSVFVCQAEDGIRYLTVTGVQTCALPICIVCCCAARHGGLASTGKAVDLKSTGAQAPWGFESLALRHSIFLAILLVLVNQDLPRDDARVGRSPRDDRRRERLTLENRPIALRTNPRLTHR